MSTDSKLRVLKIPAQEPSKNDAKGDRGSKADEGMVDHVLGKGFLAGCNAWRPNQEVFDQGRHYQKEKSADQGAAPGPS